MCCQTNTKSGHGASQGCSGPACFGPMFWSKKKRVRTVENSIECLQSQLKDLEELLVELKADK